MSIAARRKRAASSALPSGLMLQCPPGPSMALISSTMNQVMSSAFYVPSPLEMPVITPLRSLKVLFVHVQWPLISQENNDFVFIYSHETVQFNSLLLMKSFSLQRSGQQESKVTLLGMQKTMAS